MCIGRSDRFPLTPFPTLLRRAVLAAQESFEDSKKTKGHPLYVTGEKSEYNLYDPQGQRISRVSPGFLQNTLYWNGQPLADYRDGTDPAYRLVSRQSHHPGELTVHPRTRRIELTRANGSVLATVIEEPFWQRKKSGNGARYDFEIGHGKDQQLKGWLRIDPTGKPSEAHLVDKTQGHPEEYALEGGPVLDEAYYHLDHLGTPQKMTDHHQSVVWEASYAPFGALEISTEWIENDLRFPGQYFDRESGLYYNYFRYYDPDSGRYITSDPIGLRGGINTYDYVSGNPLNAIDPLGLDETKIIVPASPLVFPPGSLGYNVTSELVNNALDAVSDAMHSAVNAAKSCVDSITKMLNESADSEEGCIYCVPGEHTSSGDDYIGSTDDLEKRKRDKTDKRDRDYADVIDTYTKGDTETRRKKEQQAINDRGGVNQLDNKRNEVAPKYWPQNGITPP